MLKLFRFQLIIMFAAVLFYAAYAFASSDTNVPAGGEGVSTISGWVISNVQYRLVDRTAKVSAVEFDLDGTAKVVKVGFGSFDNKYYNCVNNNNTDWICNIYPPVRVSDMNELQVVALGK
jgi:hypothetical protein